MELKDMTLEQRKEWAKKKRKIDREEREAKILKMWTELRPFNEEGAFVPELPRELTRFHIAKLIKCGAIEKEELKDGVWYYGDYRNAKFGLWDAEKEQFKIQRYKHGRYRWDTCYHFQDDDGFALFVPLREATQEEVEEEETKR